jgi:predicted AAA+ superfamily ATPase
MIHRISEKTITSKFFKGKAIVVLGPRQVGKTTLLRNLGVTQDQILWLNGDEIEAHNLMASLNSGNVKMLLGNRKFLVVDEAQRIENIGIKLKNIIDNFPDIQVIATGSSSFDLANRISEPLTGRKWEYQLFPISFEEMVLHHGLFEEQRLLKQRLLYGYYPEVVSHPGEEVERLKLLTSSYLYKDILQWERILKSEKLVRLLQALALQIGSQVSYFELAQICGLDSKTIEKYISLLEQAFVIYRLGSFSRNLRNELKSSRKIYFVDNGVRNALINNFTPVELRADTGALWENYILSERYKYCMYHGLQRNAFFWRTIGQQEIDLIEEYDGKLHAYEFKWNSAKTIKPTRTFTNAYPGSSFEVISPETMHAFVMEMPK